MILGGSDLFTHLLIVGPTRCGKTATVLKPLIHQLLTLKAQGVPLGLSVIEPKGDVAAMVAEMSAEMGIDYVHIDPTRSDTARFNPMEGDIDTVAEATVVVLKGLFGKQEAFFATVQELSARNVTKLLKELHGDNMDIIDVMNTLRDERVLEQKVAELERRDGMTDLVHFFRSELLGSMREKYRQFVIGLRAQLENITSNHNLRQIMTGHSSFNIDEHYAKGGVLAVNTALGLLRSSGDAFGQFMIMHLQSGAFRRPGTERTRIPHFLIVDEFSRYINPDVEIFLNIAAEYRVAGIFAIQSLGQLEIESGKVGAKAMKRAILAGCRNKIVFGGIEAEDAKELAEAFGKDKIILRENTYKNNIFVPNFLPETYRDREAEEYRFDPTDLMELPRFHYVYRFLKDGHVQQPGIAKGIFIPRDWKDRREWEKGKKATKEHPKRLFRLPFQSISLIKENVKKLKPISTQNIKKDLANVAGEEPTEIVEVQRNTEPIITETIENTVKMELESFFTLTDDAKHSDKIETNDNEIQENIQEESQEETIQYHETNPLNDTPSKKEPSNDPFSKQEEEPQPTPSISPTKPMQPTTMKQEQKIVKHKLKSKDNFW